MQFDSLNKCEFIGRLGKDPELQVTPDGTPYTKFSLAVSVYQGKDNQGHAKNDTLWLNVVCWRNLAEQTEKFLVKGDKIMLIGSLVVRNYTDKDGVKRTSTEIIAVDVVKLSTGKSNGHTEASSGDPFLQDLPE